MLKQKASRAVSWSAVDQIVRQGLFFIVSVILARFVAPEAYGTVALLALFTGIAGIFVDGGLSSALIQKQDVTLTDESTVFWFNLAVGLLMTIALFLAAPWIASFFEIPVLIPIARLYSFQFLLGACNSVQNTRFTKHLDFKTPLKINSVSSVISAIIGVFLAWKGFQIWALVGQSMSAAILRTILLWKISSWRPAWVFSSKSFRTLFGFGGFLFLSWLLDVVYRKFYTLLIAKLYGVYDLGIYNRANSVKQLPTGVLSGILSRVAFPVFSEANDDPARIKRGLRMSIRGIMFINIPMMLGLAVVAEPLILTLYGPDWLPSAALLKILAFAGILWPLQVLNLSVLQALGHSRKFLKVEIIKKAVGASLILMGSYYGIEGMAWAVVLSAVFAFLFNSYYSGKYINYGAWQQTLDFIPCLASGVFMALIVFTVSHQFALSPFFQLTLLSSVGVVVYLLAVKLLRVKELNDAIRFVQLKFVELRARSNRE